MPQAVESATPFDSDAHPLDDEATIVAAAAPSSLGVMSTPLASPSTFLYIGRGLTAEQFTTYVDNYFFGTIPPDFIVLHHTAVPDTLYASYPGGWTWDVDEAGFSEGEIYQRRKAKLDSIRDLYRDEHAWDRGPHLFIDDRYIWLFTPMYEIGTHAKGGNCYYEGGQLHYSIGIEVIGYYEHVRWPEPVERLVGHAVAVLKRRLGTFELEYRPGPTNTPQIHVNSICSHRDFNKPHCPGAAISEDYYIEVLRAGWEQLLTEPIPPEPAPLTLDSPILGPPSGARDKAIAYIEAHLPANSEYAGDVQIISWYYWVHAAEVGVDPFLAIAQCVFETDSLRSYWAGRPRRNPAGLGVHKEGGLSFPSWDVAVQAHIGQLLAFTLRDDEATDAQLQMMQMNPRHHRIPPEFRGAVESVGDLGGRWTPNPNYGVNLLARAQAMLQ